MKTIKYKFIIIVGPTASGKSDVAIEIAKKTNGIIINSDSSQIYKETPILSNSPLLKEKKIAPHYLYNFVSLNQKFKVTEWLNLAIAKIKEGIANNTTPILVGGNGFYINCLIKGLSSIPEASIENIELAKGMLNKIGIEKFKLLVEEIDPVFVKKFTDPYRLLRAYSIFLETNKKLSSWQEEPRNKLIDENYMLIKIMPDRNSLYNKINQRFERMIKEGALEEASKVIKDNIEEHNYKKIIGLKELINYMNGKISLLEATERGCQKSRNYAKKQITWFKNQLKDGIIFNENNIKDILKILEL